MESIVILSKGKYLQFLLWSAVLISSIGFSAKKPIHHSSKSLNKIPSSLSNKSPKATKATKTVKITKIAKIAKTSKAYKGHNFHNAHAIFQLGGYWSTQGKQQRINIYGLIGDQFTVTNNHSKNGVIGFGYFLDCQEKEWFKMNYGINFFYLAKASVRGTIIQEDLFENLSYHYHVTHYPLYVVAKSILQTQFQNSALTIDAGIGPNFMKKSNLEERSLDGGITIPDNAFSGRTSTTFSATAGVGLRFCQIFGEAPLELGYRFFYLGKGHFNKNTDQLINTLQTGRNYAHALIASISF